MKHDIGKEKDLFLDLLEHSAFSAWVVLHQSLLAHPDILFHAVRPAVVFSSQTMIQRLAKSYLHGTKMHLVLIEGID